MRNLASNCKFIILVGLLSGLVSCVCAQDDSQSAILPRNSEYHTDSKQIEDLFQVACQATDDLERDTAFNGIVAMAHKGSPLAAYYLGLCYRDGFGTGKDLDKAMSFLQTASALGVADAKDAALLIPLMNPRTVDRDASGRDCHFNNALWLLMSVGLLTAFVLMYIIMLVIDARAKGLPGSINIKIRKIFDTWIGLLGGFIVYYGWVVWLPLLIFLIVFAFKEVQQYRFYYHENPLEIARRIGTVDAYISLRNEVPRQVLLSEVSKILHGSRNITISVSEDRSKNVCYNENEHDYHFFILHTLHMSKISNVTVTIAVHKETLSAQYSRDGKSGGAHTVDAGRCHSGELHVSNAYNNRCILTHRFAHSYVPQLHSSRSSLCDAEEVVFKYISKDLYSKLISVSVRE